MSDDETAFIEARLDEVAAAAKAASRDKPNGDAWHAGDGGDGWTQPGTPVLGPDEHLTAFAIGDYAARHIALHDPRRELAEVRAIRDLLARVDEADAASDAVDNIQIDPWTARDLRRILATAWSGHPDYRQEWKP